MQFPQRSRARLAAVVFLPVCLGLAALRENTAMADDEKTVTITVRENKNELMLRKGDTFVIKLERQAGTGFSWQIANNDNAVLKPKGEPSVEKSGDGKPGGTELQVFRFHAKAAGTSDLELHYLRPFDKDKPPARTFKLTLQVVNPD